MVFRNGTFYNYVTNSFYKTRRKKDKTYSTIYVKLSSGENTTLIVPYIICYLFRNDYLKHKKNEKNYFKYVDGNPDNCDADNIIANYYDYAIIEYKPDNKVIVNIKGYPVLLNLDFAKNELHKYNFRNIDQGKCVYFVSENTGQNIKLHQLVRKYYYPNDVITGVIDHYNHNTLDNTIENLIPTNHIINSMNNMEIKPRWDEKKQSWHVRYKVDGKGYSKSFSVFKYKTKEIAYKYALQYITDSAIPHKNGLVKNKEMSLKIKEFDELVKYFIKNDMSNKISEILRNNNYVME